MSVNINYTTVDTVFTKLYRDLQGTPLNEGDVIEWIGEALDFLKQPENLEEAVAFLEVNEHHCDIPYGLHAILQIARYNRNDYKTACICPNPECIKNLPKEKAEDCGCGGHETSEFTKDVIELCADHPVNKLGYPVPLDCFGRPITDYEVSYYRPFFDLQWEYSLWGSSKLKKDLFTPVRLANSTFFNSIVCKEKKGHDIYRGCQDEYTIVGTMVKRLRFSFREGFVAIAYLKQALDKETGYPLIPDNPSVLQAIVYYIKWKLAEWYQWNGQYGYSAIAQQAQQNWQHYVKQANNYFKMPKSIDDYQDLLEETHHLIPRLKRYYGFFGKLGREEDRKFKQRL